MARSIRGKLMHSDAIRLKQLERRTALRGDLLTYTERHVGKLVVFQPHELESLHVDGTYQRLKITTWVNELIHVLASGGTVPDPIAVARRTDGRLFIVDGQQRYWAHVEAKQPLKALVYDVKDLEEEQKLFLIFNRKKVVLGDDIVRSWPGPAVDMMREANGCSDHPMYGRMAMVRRDPTKQFQPSIVIKGLCMVATGRMGMGGIQNWVERADHAVKDPVSRERAVAILRLYGDLVEPSPDTHVRLRVLASIGLAKVAYERWLDNKVVLPTERDYRRLRLINWDAVAPTAGLKWLPMVEVEIKRRWTV